MLVKALERMKGKGDYGWDGEDGMGRMGWGGWDAEDGTRRMGRGGGPSGRRGSVRDVGTTSLLSSEHAVLCTKPFSTKDVWMGNGTRKKERYITIIIII